MNLRFDRSQKTLIWQVCLTLAVLCVAGCQKTPTDVPASEVRSTQVAPHPNCLWFADDVEILIQLRPSALMTTDAFRSFREMLESENGRLLDVLGWNIALPDGTELRPNEIESLTIGLAADIVNDLREGTHVPAAKDFAVDSLCVIRLTKARRLQAPPPDSRWQEKETGDVVYFEQESGVADIGAFAMFQPDDRTLLLGASTTVLAAIDRSARAANVTAERFQFVNAEAQIVVALAPGNLSLIRETNIPTGMPKPLHDAAAALTKNVQAGAIELNVTQIIDLIVRVECPDSPAAEFVTSALEDVLAEWKSETKTQFESQNELSFSAGLLLPIAESLAIQRTGKSVSISAHLPAETTQGLATIAASEFSRRALSALKPLSRSERSLPNVTPAESFAGLDDQAKMMATVDWSISRAMSSDPRELPIPNLETVIAITGEAAEGVIELGKIQLTTAETDVEPLLRANTLFDADAIREMIVFTPTGWIVPNPEHGFAFPITFRMPLDRPRKITKLSGTMEFVTASKGQEVTISPLALIDRETSDSILEQADLQVRRLVPTFDGDAESIAVSVKSSGAMTHLEVLGPDGGALNGAWTESQRLPGGRFQVTLMSLDEKLPAGLQLRFQLHEQLDHHTVRFDFRDLPIPVPPVELSEQQHWLRSSATDAPSGVDVTARANWDQTQSLSDDDVQQTKTIRVHINFTGPELNSPVALGQLKRLRATAVEHDLTLQDDPLGVLDDLQSELVPYDPLWISTDSPIDGMQAELMFESPLTDVQQIDQMTGEITLLSAENQISIVIDDLHTFVDRTIDHSVLKDTEITINVKNFGKGLVVTLPKDQPFSIAEMLPLDEFGRHSHAVYSGRQAFDGVTTFSFNADDELPHPLPVRMTINQGLKEFVVPFEFRNVTVPAQTE